MIDNMRGELNHTNPVEPNVSDDNQAGKSIFEETEYRLAKIPLTPRMVAVFAVSVCSMSLLLLTTSVFGLPYSWIFAVVSLYPATRRYASRGKESFYICMLLFPSMVGAMLIPAVYPITNFQGINGQFSHVAALALHIGTPYLVAWIANRTLFRRYNC